MKRVFSNNLNRTKLVLQKKPMLIGCTLSSFLLGLGDTLTQIIVEGRTFNFESFDRFGLPAIAQKVGFPITKKTEEIHQPRIFEIAGSIPDRDQNRDFSTQEKPSYSDDFDFARVGKSMAIGFFVMAPNLFLWYRKGLPRLLSNKALSKFTPIQRNMIVTCVDQSMFFTYWSALFIFSHALLTDSCHMKAYMRVKEDLGERVKNNWMYWPAIVLFNLTFIHPLFRTAFINFFGVWYNVGSAAIKNRV